MAKKGTGSKGSMDSFISGCCGKGQLKDEIAKIANDLYEKSGKVSGHDLDNWLKAEKMVMAKNKRPC